VRSQIAVQRAQARGHIAILRRKVQKQVLQPQRVIGLDAALGLFGGLLDGQGIAYHAPPR